MTEVLMYISPQGKYVNADRLVCEYCAIAAGGKADALKMRHVKKKDKEAAGQTSLETDAPSIKIK